MLKNLPDWTKRGLTAGISAVLLSLFVAVFMTSLSLMGMPVIKSLEASSRDFTFRAAAAVYGPIDWRSHRGTNTIDPLVFIDIDEAGCAALVDEPWECRVSGVVHQEVMMLLARGLRDAGAKAIMLDTLLPDEHWDQRPEERDAYFEAWVQHSAPVVSAMPGAAGQDNVFVADDRHFPTNSAISFAPAVLFDSRTTGGELVRDLDRSIAVQRVSDGAIETRSTLAFELLDQLKLDYERDDEEAIFFTLPSTIGDTTFQGGGWERRALSQMLTRRPNGDMHLETTGLADQILLVGSSAPAAGDLHVTALGTMAGPEILANIIRDVQIFPKRGQITLFDSFLWKITSLTPAALVLMLAELASAYTKQKGAQRNWKALARWSAYITIWTVALVLALLSTSYFALDGLISTGSFELKGDLLLPIFALFLEEFVRVCSKVIAWLENQVAQLFA